MILDQITHAKFDVKVMSFNAKREYFPIGKQTFSRRKEVIKRLIDKYDPDIIGTQELTQQMVKTLEELLKDYQYVGDGRSGGNKGEHTAIFYKKEKFELQENDTFWLSPTPHKPSKGWFALFPRTCTRCTLSLKQNPQHLLMVYNTHLDHISGLARLKGLELIAKKILKANEQKNIPTLLMGDFNTTPTSKTMSKWQIRSAKQNKLSSIYEHMTEKQIGRSYHAYRGKETGKPIDYIYTSDDIKVQSAQICRDKLDGTFPSDHYPLFAALKIQ